MTVYAITDTKKGEQGLRLLICRRQQQQEILQFVFAFFHVPHFTLRSAVLFRMPNSAFYTFAILCIPQSAFYLCPTFTVTY